MAGNDPGLIRLALEVSNIIFGQQAQGDVQNAVSSAVGAGMTNAVTTAASNPSFKSILAKAFSLDLEKGEDGKEHLTTASKAKIGAVSTGAVADGLIKVVKSGFGIIEDIYKQLVQASPLLQTIESLFDLAVQLFFMPLGNKLAEVILPAMLDMIDAIMDMWDSFDGDPEASLKYIFETTLSKFSEIFVGFLKDIGDTLADQGGLLGTIGKFIKSTANFVEKILPGLMNAVISVLGFILDNFPLILALITAFKIEQATLSIMQIAATLSESMPLGGIFAAGSILALLASLGVGGAVAAGSHADGGYIPATNGGQLGVLGEGGEGEWIVPDSKVGDFISQQSVTRNLKVGGNIGGESFTFNLYGYNDRELGDIIENKVNEMSNRSRLRSGV